MPRGGQLKANWCCMAQHSSNYACYGERFCKSFTRQCLLNLANSQIYATQMKDVLAALGKQMHSQPAFSPSSAILAHRGTTQCCSSCRSQGLLSACIQCIGCLLGMWLQLPLGHLQLSAGPLVQGQIAASSSFQH